MKIKSLYFLLIAPLLLFSQVKKLDAHLVGSIALVADGFIGFDKFGYQYSILDAALVKSNGKDNVEYANISFGGPTRVDIANPLLIVLFYEPFNTVILLDNQLNEIRRINFSELDLPLIVHAAGLASQNRLWIYDSQQQQLGLYDYSQNLHRTIAAPFPQNFRFYQTTLLDFYWIDDALKMFSCDVFGKVAAWGEVRPFESIQVLSSDMLLYVYQGRLYLDDRKNNIAYSIEGIDKTISKFTYKDQILSIFTDKGITNYKITIP